jgi:hypothetical protein
MSAVSGAASSGATRPSFVIKEIEAALQYAESRGWTVKLARGAVWARIYSPLYARDGRRISVWSTPRMPQAHARDILRMVDGSTRDGPSE